MKSPGLLLTIAWIAGFSVLTVLWVLGSVSMAAPSTPSIAPTPELIDEVEKVVSWRMDTYRELLQGLYANLRMQGIAAFVGAAVMLRRRLPRSVARDDHFTLLDISIPPIALHVLLPATLLTLWFQFGYMMNTLIHQRIDLFSIMTHLPETLKSLCAARSLNDGGFLDAWFRAFHPESIDGQPISLLGFVGNGVALFMVYGGILGASHAVLLGLLFSCYIDINMHLQGHGDPAKRQAFWFLAATAIAGAILMATHYQFFFSGENPNWQQGCTGLMTLGLLKLLWVARRAIAAQEQQK